MLLHPAMHRKTKAIPACETSLFNNPTGPNDLATWIAERVFFVSSPFSHRPKTSEPIDRVWTSLFYHRHPHVYPPTLFFATPPTICRIPRKQNISTSFCSLTSLCTEKWWIEPDGRFIQNSNPIYYLLRLTFLLLTLATISQWRRRPATNLSRCSAEFALWIQESRVVLDLASKLHPLDSTTCISSHSPHITFTNGTNANHSFIFDSVFDEHCPQVSPPIGRHYA